MALFTKDEIELFYKTVQSFRVQFNTYGNQIQKEFLQFLFSSNPEDLDITEAGYGGGAGGGKTYSAIFWSWTMRIKYPNTSAFWGRITLKKVKTTTFKTYKKFLRDYNVPPILHGKYNGQTNTIEFPNWSWINFLELSSGGKQDEDFGTWGGEYTDGVIEEVQEIDSDVIDALRVRVWRQENKKYGLPPRIVETFNPDKGHVYKRFWLPFKNNEMPANRRFYRALATDNKYNDERYLDSLRNIKNKARRERLYNWNFDYSELPWELFSYDKLIALRTNPRVSGERILVVDPARMGGDTITITAWNGNTMIYYEEYEYEKTTYTQDRVKKIAQKIGIPYDKILIDGNGLGAGIADNLKGSRLFINNGSPIDMRSEEEKKQARGVIPNFGMLKDQCYFMLSEVIENNGLCIPEEVMEERYFEKLIEELENTVEDNLEGDKKRQVIKKEKLKKKIGRSPDRADNVMMTRHFYLVPIKKKKKGVTL